MEPKWLDDEQLEAWLRFARVLVALPAELDSEMQRRAGVTQFEYAVMAGLSESPGRAMRISTLADYARGSLSRLSHLINRLERRGWIRRELHPEDGRSTNPTTGGSDIVERLLSDQRNKKSRTTSC